MKPETRRALLRVRRETVDITFIYFLISAVGNRFLAPEKGFNDAALAALIFGLLWGGVRFFNRRSRSAPDPRLRDGPHKQARSLF